MKQYVGWKAFWLVLALVGTLGPARANVTTLVALEPTLRKDGLMISRPGLESGLSSLLGRPVTVSSTEDLSDTMRATRSGGYDIFVAPPQVVASALAHGYELLGSTDAEEEYVLVGRTAFAKASDIKAGRIYLPQQDSIYTYMARGMLTANGLSFKDLGRVEYARYPQAGLLAVTLGLTDATVIRKRDWDGWQAENPGKARVLASSGPVPGGFSVAVKKDMSTEQRARLAKWFGSASTTIGMKNVASHSALPQYERVAQLGTFTPNALPGVSLVTAADVSKLISAGATVVDTRTDKEFAAKRLPGARHVPYGEKSLKDVVYDATADDFKGLKQLDPGKPTIFHCNGAECWKSYKASKAAAAAGFSKVYWFRGGLPEWEKAGLPVDRTPATQTAQR
jgi:rhodanese-related sulfurtransferase/ABC-type phosphate/phosphonate transport system substrate-binding protein